jgi:hypothetical protein
LASTSLSSRAPIYPSRQKVKKNMVVIKKPIEATSAGMCVKTVMESPVSRHGRTTLGERETHGGAIGSDKPLKCGDAIALGVFAGDGDDCACAGRWRELLGRVRAWHPTDKG